MYELNKEAIIKRIKHAMDAKGLTDEMLANQADIPTSRLKYYFRKKTSYPPKAETIAAIAPVLGVSVNYLLGIPEVEQPDSAPIIDHSTSGIIKALENNQDFLLCIDAIQRILTDTFDSSDIDGVNLSNSNVLQLVAVDHFRLALDQICKDNFGNRKQLLLKEYYGEMLKAIMENRDILTRKPRPGEEKIKSLVLEIIENQRQRLESVDNTFLFADANNIQKLIENIDLFYQSFFHPEE